MRFARGVFAFLSSKPVVVAALFWSAKLGFAVSCIDNFNLLNAFDFRHEIAASLLNGALGVRVCRAFLSTTAVSMCFVVLEL